MGGLLAAGVALRAAVWIGYRPALVYIDTARYLGDDKHGLDPLGYSYLLPRPVLLAGGGLAGVAALQHLIGLAMGACLYALLLRHGAGRWLAALAAAPVLLDSYQVQAEQMIMPDVLFEALIVAAMTLLLWRPEPGLARVAGGAALLGLSATVRQVGEVLILPLLAYVLVLATRKVRRQAAWAAAALAAFALPVVGYMAVSAAVLGNGFRLSNMDDAYLYGRLAHAADCATLRVPADARPLCPPPATAAALGVDGLATNPASAVFRYQPPPGVGRGAAARKFDQAVLTQQPLRVAGDVTRDAIKVFALTRNTAQGDTPVSRWQFQPRASVPLAGALRWYQLHGGFTPGPLLLLFLLSATAGVFARNRDPALALGCLLATGLAVAVLLGADLYEFSWRYQLPGLVTLPAAGALGATMIRCTLTRRSGRSPAASSTPTTGSGSARTRSSDGTVPAEPTPS